MLCERRTADLSGMGKNRSSVLIAIGAAVFIVGAGLAFLAVRSGGGDDNKPQLQTAATTAEQKAGQVTAPGAATPSFEIPTGKQAVAVQVPYVQGVAGFVKAGDKVNVFGTIKSGPPPKGFTSGPVAKLILSDVLVLSVSAPAASAAGGPTTFVLALNPTDAEQVVYFQSFEGLYMSLARSDQGVVQTPGRSAGAPL
jgi:hypothetical protein